MPLSPAASTTEKARYGLHDGSGARNSMREESAFPALIGGTFTTTERLLLAQLTYTGASNPVTRRL